MAQLRLPAPMIGGEFMHEDDRCATAGLFIIEFRRIICNCVRHVGLTYFPANSRAKAGDTPVIGLAPGRAAPDLSSSHVRSGAAMPGAMTRAAGTEVDGPEPRRKLAP